MSKRNPESSKSKGLIPNFVFRDVTDITPQFLSRQNIKFLMMDLDNTIAAYNEHVISDSIKDWVSETENSGVKLFVISNSTRTSRVTSLSESIGVKFIMKACKPSGKSLQKAMEMTNFDTANSALVGDQIFTDGIAAKRAGVTSLIVRPRRFTNPFLAIRYFFELPFRAFSIRQNINLEDYK